MGHTDEKVAGYSKQPQYKIDTVNQNKVLEAYILDQIERLEDHASMDPTFVDRRMLALAKTNIEQGFMWLNRAIFQPKRVHAVPPPMSSVQYDMRGTDPEYPVNNIDPKQGAPETTDAAGQGDIRVQFVSGGIGSPVRPPEMPQVWEDDEETEAVRLANREQDDQLSGTMEAHLAHKAAFGT